MRKAVRFLSAAVLAMFTAMIVGILAFYIVIVAGASPRLQTIWICSAMRTMSHKHLATAFFSDEYIDSILKANEVDDTGYDSEILDFSNKNSGNDSENSAFVSDDKNSDESETELPEESSETDEGTTEESTEETTGESSDETTEEPEESTESDNSVKEEESDSSAESETEPNETEKAPETEPEFDQAEKDYIAEGYEMLEEGLYLKEVSGLTWRGYVMLVENPMRVKLTDTSKQYECGENVMTMTKNAGAVAGINGGGFTDGPNYDSNGGSPAGLIIEDRNLVWPLEPDDTVYNMIGINKNGALVLRHCTAQWALENDIVSAVSFWPFIVVNGEGLVKNGTGGWGIAPRTAIGQRKSGEFLLLVIDGRQPDWSIGCDLDVLQQVMLEEDAYNAAMLDGGSSTAMVYDGEYINRPSLGHERWINNSFVVMPNETNG